MMKKKKVGGTKRGQALLRAKQYPKDAEPQQLVLATISRATYMYFVVSIGTM